LAAWRPVVIDPRIWRDVPPLSVFAISITPGPEKYYVRAGSRGARDYEFLEFINARNRSRPFSLNAASSMGNRGGGD